MSDVLPPTENIYEALCHPLSFLIVSRSVTLLYLSPAQLSFLLHWPRSHRSSQALALRASTLKTHSSPYPEPLGGCQPLSYAVPRAWECHHAPMPALCSWNSYCGSRYPLPSVPWVSHVEYIPTRQWLAPTLATLERAQVGDQEDSQMTRNMTSFDGTRMGSEKPSLKDG